MTNTTGTHVPGPLITKASMFQRGRNLTKVNDIDLIVVKMDET
jgi:hypothetical protein